jgi:hypothetical protein
VRAAVAAVPVITVACAGAPTAPAGPDGLAILAAATSATACVPIGPLRVAAMRNGAPDASASGQLRVAIVPGSGTPGAVLSGRLQRDLVAGVATFDDLKLNASGAGYRLEVVAVASVLAPVRTAGLDVVAGGPAQLLVTAGPPLTVTGPPLPVVRVAVQDACGSTMSTATNVVSLALTGGNASATLGGTTAVAAVAGMATFADLSVSLAGASYRLLASSAGLSGASSAGFTVAIPAR